MSGNWDDRGGSGGKRYALLGTASQSERVPRRVNPGLALWRKRRARKHRIDPDIKALGLCEHSMVACQPWSMHLGWIGRFIVIYHEV
jgi:hypothetical protein